MAVGDSGTGGGISATRIAAGGSENIMNGAAATANGVKMMSDSSVTASSNSNLLQI